MPQVGRQSCLLLFTFCLPCVKPHGADELLAQSAGSIRDDNFAGRADVRQDRPLSVTKLPACLPTFGRSLVRKLVRTATRGIAAQLGQPGRIGAAVVSQGGS